jgi:hypothetical protein
MAYPAMTEGDVRADEEALKHRFIGRAKAMAGLPEYARHQDVALLIHQSAAFGLRGVDVEIFRSAYGDPTGRAFWDAFLRKPMPVTSLAQMFSAFLMEKALRVEDVELLVLRALRDAAQNGETWFVREPPRFCR